MGSSEGSGQVVHGVLVESVSSASWAGSAVRLLPSVVGSSERPGSGPAEQRPNEHVRRVSSFPSSGTAVALSAPPPPSRCEAQHAGHLLASSYFTLRGIEVMEQTEEEFYLQ